MTTRLQTVAHGYLGVVEGYRQPGDGSVWCTLTVQLPCPVPALAVDHRAALGRPGVPFANAHILPGVVSHFDDQYLVSSPDPRAAADLLTPALCDVLVGRPTQRLTFERQRLLIRTFDDSDATQDVEHSLTGLAAAVLAATPGFVMRGAGRAWVRAPARPFPPGVYGREDPDGSRADSALGRARGGRFAFVGRNRAQ